MLLSPTAHHWTDGEHARNQTENGEDREGSVNREHNADKTF